MIGFEGGFHGRTLLALSLTSKTHPYKAGLGPFAPEVYRVAFNDLDALEFAFKAHVAAEDVAAIVFEPVQGESGFLVPSQEFVEGMRRLCDEHGIVLVADEVQTGFCRTGKTFAIEHFGVEPDLITIAKSVAAGLPLSGVLGRAEIMDAPGDSAVGGTYVGNPVAIAAAHAVLDVIAEEGLNERAQAIGETIRARMESWRDRLRRRRGRARASARCSRSGSSATASLTPTWPRRSPRPQRARASCSSRPASTPTASACSSRSSSRTRSSRRPSVCGRRLCRKHLPRPRGAVGATLWR